MRKFSYSFQKLDQLDSHLASLGVEAQKLYEAGLHKQCAVSLRDFVDRIAIIIYEQTGIPFPRDENSGRETDKSEIMLADLESKGQLPQKLAKGPCRNLRLLGNRGAHTAKKRDKPITADEAFDALVEAQVLAEWFYNKNTSRKVFLPPGKLFWAVVGSVAAVLLVWISGSDQRHPLPVTVPSQIEAQNNAVPQISKPEPQIYPMPRLGTVFINEIKVAKALDKTGALIGEALVFASNQTSIVARAYYETGSPGTHKVEFGFDGTRVPACSFSVQSNTNSWINCRLNGVPPGDHEITVYTDDKAAKQQSFKMIAANPIRSSRPMPAPIVRPPQPPVASNTESELDRLRRTPGSELLRQGGFDTRGYPQGHVDPSGSYLIGPGSM